MSNDIRLDFEVHWTLNPVKLIQDPLHRTLRKIRYFPYRVYLVPSGELIADRLFDVEDPYFIQEIHFLHLDHGQWSLSCHDVSGYLNLEMRNVRLNTVAIDSPTFSL
jgi:hypothetical protein